MNQQLKYHIAFNKYLKHIRDLLKQNSLRQLKRLYPYYEWSHIRLASETKSITYDDSLYPYSVHEVIKSNQNKIQKKKFIGTLLKNKITIKELKKKLKQSNKYIKNINDGSRKELIIDTTCKTDWLNDRKNNLNKYN